MARAGITYSEVATAAARLSAEGKNPTVDTVREAIGGTGSKSTIAPMLKRWKAEHQEQVFAHDAGLPADLLQAVKGLYEHLQQDADQKVQAAQSALAAAQRDFAAQLKMATDNAAALAKERDTLQSLLTQERVQNDQLTESNRAYQVACVKAEMEATGLAQRLADRQNEVESLNRQLEQTRTQFEHYQEAIAAQRAEERQTAERRIARVEQDLVSANRQITAQQSTLGQQEIHIAHLTSENVDLKQALRVAQEELATVRSARERLSERLEDAEAARQGLADEVDALQKQWTDTRMALAAQEREASMLAEQAHRAEARADHLAAERLSWLQERAALEQQISAAEQKAASLIGPATTP
ncbi:hypothetical protein ABF87_05375 [Nitrosomonas sp. JL21]|uniref:DNA-binding protein n=1 Tax=Nitrosomonas sp. JL21 TaxID=153949 RepID=UPI00136AF4D2|nr:DNA-binding protein [Nitrosomonas sp. JL21]MXS77399.1 hypothetical protein [Nitrosomonas sp. JL21]